MKVFCFEDLKVGLTQNAKTSWVSVFNEINAEDSVKKKGYKFWAYRCPLCLNHHLTKMDRLIAKWINLLHILSLIYNISLYIIVLKKY